MLTLIAADRPRHNSEHPSPRSAHYLEIRKRAKAILRAEVDFIPNASFAECDQESEDSILRTLARSATAGETPQYEGKLPAHLAGLCEARLLTAEEERELFRAMNYAKYRVNVLRSQLAPETPELALIEKAETFLRVANTIRNRIIQANMRLAMSVVKKHVTPQYSFDELLSDGTDTLMQAVDKFDFERGFRFSTYAYRAITHRVYRQISSRQKLARRFADAVDETELCHQEDSARPSVTPSVWGQFNETLVKMLSSLDRRERFIVRRRYGMGRNQKTATFQSMASKLGISKERVRQLESRAVGKLKKMAAEQGMADVLA